MFFTAKAAPADIAGVRVKPSSRARRLSLRVEAKSGEVVLVWPARAKEAHARRFVEENRAWIAAQRAKSAQSRAFSTGMTINIAGNSYVIEHAAGRGLTRLEGSRLIVHGRPEHLPRRIKDFLKAEAEKILRKCADEKACSLDLSPALIRVIDPKTRWGSCGADGRMMFSWRLVLAPPDVLDYVVAHETAHRVHMNHGKKFWALCASLTKDAPVARRWLRAHGAGLLAYR